MSRFVIVLQHHDGDRDQAVRLLNAIVDIETRAQMKRATGAIEGVEILLVHRADGVPIAKTEVMPLGAYFEIHRLEANIPERGHPQACNAMAAFVFRKAEEFVQSGIWKDVTGMLLLEPDCVPVSLWWLDALRYEWDLANRLMDRPYVMGCYRDQGVDRPHVNGVGIWRPDLVRYVAFPRPDCGMGWDSALGPQLERRIFRTSLISNLFRETNVPMDRITKNPFTPPGTPAPVLIHGVKDESAWAAAEILLAQ